MAMDVKVTFRSYLHGFSGTSLTGVPVPQKQLVAGEISITSYTASGEPLTPTDLGLTAINYIGFDVRSVNNAATVPASGAIPMAAYDQSSQLLIVNIDHGADTAVSTGEAAVVRFIALGDSSLAPDLT